MIISHSNRKVELKSEPTTSSTNIEFYNDNKLIMSLVVNEDYSKLEQNMLISRAYIQIATQFVYEGFYDLLLKDIAEKLEDNIKEINTYRRNYPSDSFMTDFYINLYLRDSNILNIEFDRGDIYLERIYLSLFTKISDNTIYISDIKPIKYPLSSLMSLTLQGYVNNNSEYEILVNCHPCNYDSRYDLYDEESIPEDMRGDYHPLVDYNVHFLISTKQMRGITNPTYLNTVNFLETGHLFSLSKEQKSKLAKMKLSNNYKDTNIFTFDDGITCIIIKAVNPDGTVEF